MHAGGLHALGVHAQLAGDGAEIQVPVSRQRILQGRHQFRRPGTRPLERYAIHVADDGQLEVDKSRKYQEELGQWLNPDCFVEV